MIERRIVPSIGGCFRDAVDERGETNHREDQADHIETLPSRLDSFVALVGGAPTQHKEAEQNGEYADGDIHREDRAPVERGGEIAADGRAERWGQQHWHANQRAGKPALGGWEDAEHNRQRQREERTAADALKHSECNQHSFVGGDSAESGAERKEREAEEEDRFAAYAITDVARDRNDCCLRQQIRRYDPGDRLERGVKRRRHLWERDVDDGVIENRHEQANRGHYCRLPFIC